MIYAAKTKATDNALTVGGLNGKLLNDVYAFDNLKEMRERLDAEFWPAGNNLIRIPAKRVYKEYPNMAIEDDGLVTNDAG